MTSMRVPPNSLDLERAVLCAAFCDPAVLDVCDRVTPETFYSDANATLWKALHGARSRGLVPDHVNVRDELVRMGKLASIGGDDYLFDVTSSIPAHDAEARAEELLNLAQRRAVLSVCMTAAARGYDRAISDLAYLEEVQSTVFAATVSARQKGKLVQIDPRPTIQRIDDVSRGEVSPMGTTTGLAALDTKSRGFGAGQLWVVAGRPGMGKSSLALVSAVAVARAAHSVAFFSLEMTKLELEERCMSLISGVPSASLREGRIQVNHVPRVTAASAEMRDLPLYIDDTPGLAIPAMRARLRELAAKAGKPIGLVVVDHIGLARSGMRTDSREQEVSEIARALKELAKEFSCTVLALSQLNRECEKSADKRPSLHHLRDSGEIEQSADVVVFVYRRGYYAAEKKAGRLQEDRFSKSDIEAGDDDGRAELIIAKRRGGATGTVHCLWEGECTRFVDADRDEYRPTARFRGGEDD